MRRRLHNSSTFLDTFGLDETAATVNTADVVDVKRFFRKIYEYWMAFGHAIGVVMTPVWMFLVYVAVFGPSRLVAAAMRMDPLDRKMAPASSFWKTREPHPHTLEEARRQF